MNRSLLKKTVLVVALATASASGGYWLAMRGALSTENTGTGTAAMVPSKEKQVLYWFDPMEPNQHFDKPGKSPFMDMELVPKYADETGDDVTDDDSVRVSDAMAQNLGVRYAAVEKGALPDSLQAPANVVFNERDVAIVQVKSAGFVEKVYPHAPGDVIQAGAPLLQLLVPEWASAQAEYLGLRKSGETDLAQAARERLRMLGMPESSVRQIEQSGKAQTIFTVVSPIAGVIQSLEVRQGMAVSSGMTIARINGLETVWLEAAVPETNAGRLTSGQLVTAVLTAYPQTSFKGRISEILPETNMQTRTLRVRMEFANPQGLLRPGMYAQVQLDSAGKDDVLLVPTEAVIRTGTRNLVIVVEDGGRFRPVSVLLGAESGARTEVVSGLEVGQRVVASGQFLIDSEASLNGVLARMEAPAKPAEMTAPEAGIVARGVIESIGKEEIILSHEAIPALGWSAMTMPFTVAARVHTDGLRKGQTIRFTLEKKGDDIVIVRIEPQTQSGGKQ